MFLFEINSLFFIFLTIALVNAFMLNFSSYKFLQGLQLSGYQLKNYFKYLTNFKLNKYLSLLLINLVIFVIITLINFIIYSLNFNIYLISSTILVYFLGNFYYILKNKKVKNKLDLKNTARIKRFKIFFFVVNVIFGFYLVNLGYKVFTPLVSLIVLSIILMPFIIAICFIILVPLEELIKKYYLIKAKTKLKKFKHLIKIGITGSFGKTSTKYILNTLLSQKYKVCMSPSSYNTPMGLSKVVNNYLKEVDEVLIAEMGAKKQGEIKTLAKFIKPQYAILTAVGSQHLETFKSVENIKKTKYELVENLHAEGIAVFNGDNALSKELYDKSEFKNKFFTSLKNKKAFVKASKITVNEKGSSFEVQINNKKPFEVFTVMLGEHNIQNILLAVAICVKLGLTTKQIKAGISKLKSVPHRLQLINSPSKVTILDDSFNASVEGSISALKVLGLFKNKRKIILTPGLVELGVDSYKQNYLFGVRIASVCDMCIIVNKVNNKPIKKGLLDKGFKKENIFEFATLLKAQEKLKTLLKANDVLLIENDLPDNYN